jgi:hypothetical protein
MLAQLWLASNGPIHDALALSSVQFCLTSCPGTDRINFPHAVSQLLNGLTTSCH